MAAVSERSVAQLRASGTCEIFEKEYFRSDGSRVPVLVAATVIGTPGTRPGIRARPHGAQARREERENSVRPKRLSLYEPVITSGIAHRWPRDQAADRRSRDECQDLRAVATA